MYIFLQYFVIVYFGMDNKSITSLKTGWLTFLEFVLCTYSITIIGYYLFIRIPNGSSRLCFIIHSLIVYYSLYNFIVCNYVVRFISICFVIKILFDSYYLLNYPYVFCMIKIWYLPYWININKRNSSHIYLSRLLTSCITTVLFPTYYNVGG